MDRLGAGVPARVHLAQAIALSDPQPHRLHRWRHGPESALACQGRLQMYYGSEGSLVRSARRPRQSLQGLCYASWARGPRRCLAGVDWAGGLSLQGVVEILRLPPRNENRRLGRHPCRGDDGLCGSRDEHSTNAEVVFEVDDNRRQCMRGLLLVGGQDKLVFVRNGQHWEGVRRILALDGRLERRFILSIMIIGEEQEMLALHIVPDCLISGIIGYVEVAETYKLQMQILIPTRLPLSGLEEGHLSFEIVIEEHSNVHGLTATR